MLNYIEKRRSSRFIIPGGGGKYKRGQLQGAMKGFSEKFPLLNISEGGAAFKSEENLNPEEELLFQLLTPEIPSLNLFSQVRRQNMTANHTGNTIGIEFMSFGNGNGVNTLEKLQVLRGLYAQYGDILQPHITFKPEWGAVHSTARGDLNNTYLLEIVKRAFRIAEEHECRKIIFDFSKMNITESLIGIYEYPALARSEGIPLSLKMAILYTNDHDNFRFLETVCVNSGYNIRIFKDNNRAIEWIADS